MKRVWQLLLGAAVALVLLGAVLLAVAAVVIGRWITPDYLEAELEKQLACDAEIGAVEVKLFRLGQPAGIVLREISLAPGPGAVQRLQAEGVKLSPEQTAQIETLATQPVVLVDQAELQLNRRALLRRQVDVGKIVFTRPTLRVLNIEGLGSTLQALAKPKPVRQPDAVPPPQPVPPPKKQPEKPTLLNLRNLMIVGGQVEFSQYEPNPKVKPGQKAEAPLQFAVMDLNFQVSDLALGGAGALEVPFLLSGQLTIDQGEELRWLALDLNGGGRIHFPDAKKRELAGSTWEIGFDIGPESFLWGGELIADLRKQLDGLSRFGLVRGDWEVSERGVFPPGQRFELKGDGTQATLGQPLRVNFDEAWLRVDAGGTLELDGEMEHRFTGRLRPPAELADGAYQKIPEALSLLGGMGDDSWEKIRTAYFVEKELQLPLVSDGPIGDAEVRVEPEPLELMDGVKELIDTGEGILDALLGRSREADKPKLTQEERAERHRLELERRRAERRAQRQRERLEAQQRANPETGESAGGSGAETTTTPPRPAAADDAEASLEAALESAAQAE